MSNIGKGSLPTKTAGDSILNFASVIKNAGFIQFFLLFSSFGLGDVDLI